MREATSFEFRDIKRPIDDDKFSDIELALNSLRDMKYEHCIVEFSNSIDNLDFIQTASMESYKTLHIEWGYKREGKSFPRLIAKDNVPVAEGIRIFKSICCSTENIDISDWEDITQKVLENEGIEDK